MSTNGLAQPFKTSALPYSISNQMTEKTRSGLVKPGLHCAIWGCKQTFLKAEGYVLRVFFFVLEREIIQHYNYEKFTMPIKLSILLTAYMMWLILECTNVKGVT